MKKTVGEVFRDLKASLETNMNHVYQDDKINKSQAGHYPAAILIVVGSEALSRLQGKGADRVFAEMMSGRGVEEPLARKLFGALRNGLAHIWDTNFLDAGSEQVELIVSWREKKHLSLRTLPSLGLHLNVADMWSDLQRALTGYDAVLEHDPEKARALPPGTWSEKSTTSVTESQDAYQAWRRFQATAPREEAS